MQSHTWCDKATGTEGLGLSHEDDLHSNNGNNGLGMDQGWLACRDCDSNLVRR
jgi:hypothetical protein